MNLFQKTLRGFSWMSGLVIFTKGLALFKIAVLARILTPSQFGTYGIALLTLGLLEMLTETGVNIFLIQEKSKIKSYLNSSWAVSIIRGLLIGFIIILSTFFIPKFFNIPHVRNLLYLISFVAIIRGFINPMKVNFQKELEFKKVFFFQGFLYFIDAITAIGLALAFRHESSLVFGMLLAALTEVIISFIIFKDKPKFIFEKKKFLKVINSGKWVTGASIASYIFQNIDNAVIGKLMGATSLGFYQQSYSIATLPVTAVSDIYNKVMFPIYSKMTDINKLRTVFYKVFFGFLALSTIFGLFIILYTNQIVLIFLGSNWISIVPVLKVLVILGVLKSILNTSYSLFLALKMQKVVMYSEVLGIIGMLIVIYPLIVKFGNLGAAIGAITAVVCSIPVVIYNLRKVFK